MEKNIEKIKNNLIKIVNEDKVKTLEFIEEDKLHIVIVESNVDNQTLIKEQVIKLIKIDFQIPKLKLEFEKIVEEAFVNANKILITSGKGGVGKSTVTANIARSLSKRGYKVAIIDADIYGSSIPLIFNQTSSPEVVDNRVQPLRFDNIEMIGTLNVNPKDEPIVWRGPKLGGLIRQFFTEIDWSKDIEYLLVDLPPGTGDIPLDLNGLVPDAKCIVVTTPHENACRVAIKAGDVAKMQGHDMIGVVENMSYYTHNDEKLYIFGQGGGRTVADHLDTRLLKELPIVPDNQDNLDEYNDILDEIEKVF